jgi:hypothetical protein
LGSSFSFDIAAGGAVVVTDTANVPSNVGVSTSNFGQGVPISLSSIVFIIGAVHTCKELLMGTSIKSFNNLALGTLLGSS